MVPRYKSRRTQTLLLSRVILFILLVLVVFLGRSVWNVYVKERDTSERFGRASADHDELVERSLFLDREVKRLATSYGVEEEARRRFGLAKVGEKVFIIVDSESGAATSTDKSFWDYVLFWRD